MLDPASRAVCGLSKTLFHGRSQRLRWAAALFGAGALVCLVAAYVSFRGAEQDDLSADGVVPRVQLARECQRVSTNCASEGRLKSEEGGFRASAEERRIRALGYGTGGVLLAMASAAAFVFGYERRRRGQTDVELSWMPVDARGALP
jgi:hypothetical protein